MNSRREDDIEQSSSLLKGQDHNDDQHDNQLSRTAMNLEPSGKKREETY